MKLEEYKRKRDFSQTGEPLGEEKQKKKEELEFVIQKHQARRLHYDFRIELNGVLVSWAIPKQPSLNPKDKRLAIKVEDHPLGYKNFEGVIPEGNYGAGTVMVWDKGTYSVRGIKGREETEKEVQRHLDKGRLSIVLNGEKLKGRFSMVRSEENKWLFFKLPDEFVSADGIIEENNSVLSGRNLEQIASSGKIWLTAEQRKHARVVKWPEKLKAMEPKRANEPFNDAHWLFEIKYEGYRTLVIKKNNNVTFQITDLESINNEYEELTEAFKQLDCDAVIDGVIAMVNEKGYTDRELLKSYPEKRSGTLYFYAFDLPFYENLDLRKLPLKERKKILEQVVANNQKIVFSGHVEGKGLDFHKQASKLKVKGIIAKKMDSHYKDGQKTGDWLSISTG